MKRAQIVSLWHAMLEEWMRANIHSQAPRHLLTRLTSLAESAQIDALALDEYFQVTCVAQDPIVSFRQELWRLNLLPDDRVLDTPSGRLALNISAKQLLTAASDTQADANRLQRLQQAAEKGNTVAQAALKYRSERRRELLMPVELDAFLNLISPKAPPGPRPPSPVDLIDFLDLAEKCGREAALATIAELESDWDLSATDSLTLEGTFTLPDGPERTVKTEVEPQPQDERIWVGDGSAASQAVAFVVGASARRDWLPKPSGVFSGEELLAVAKAQDLIRGAPLFEELTTQFLAARARLAPFERWMRKASFELLLISDAAREAISEYLDAWRALVASAADLPGDEADAIRQPLALLEAVWGTNADQTPAYTWCALGPFHPYITEPLLKLASYAHAAIADPELGGRVSWALERSIPAYRVMWAQGTSLFLSRVDHVLEFDSNPHPHHVPAVGGDGLVQVIKSFVGYYPYAKSGLTLTFINPPTGGAVSRNLRRIAQLVDNLRIYVVATRADVSHLEEFGEGVRFLGRFSNIEDWIQRSPVRSHVIVEFGDRPGGTDTAAKAGWGPTAGAHVALKISYRSSTPPRIPLELVPYVTFEPRSDNGSVLSLQRLSSPNTGAPKLFEIQPTLSEVEIGSFGRLASLCDWAVLAAPSPLGLIAPFKIGDAFTYVGRENLGSYALFTYATSLFAIRRHVMSALGQVPVNPTRAIVEQQLASLALESPNGVLRIGRSTVQTLWEQFGVLLASQAARQLQQ